MDSKKKSKIVKVGAFHLDRDHIMQKKEKDKLLYYAEYKSDYNKSKSVNTLLKGRHDKFTGLSTIKPISLQRYKNNPSNKESIIILSLILPRLTLLIN